MKHKKNDLIFKVHRLRLAAISFILAFFGALVVHGFVISKVWSCLIAALLVATATSLFSYKKLNVIVSDTSLTAPVVKGLLSKPVKIDLKEVIVSRGLLAWVMNSQLSMTNGENFNISPLFYPIRDIQRLLREVESRKNKMDIRDEEQN